MGSNTSIGRCEKGSKFWMQTLVNLDGGTTLQKAIQRVDPSIGNIEWKSPLKENTYIEFKTKGIKELEGADLNFWPDNGPWWDGVGINDDGCILLVEAKGHINETKTCCKAVSTKSIDKIKGTMREAHCAITSVQKSSHEYDENVWINEYYQLGNRLSFLVMLRAQGYNVKLVLLNIVNDPTHIKTTMDEWDLHYKDVFSKMTGANSHPENVLLVNVDLG